MNKDQSLRVPLLNKERTGKEFAADGLADYLEERSQVESSSSPFSNKLRFRSASFLLQWHAAF
jgi:hypothetical protein